MGIIVTYVLVVSAAVQLLYYGVFFGRLAFFPKEKAFGAYVSVDDKDLPSISVVICARNEAENLRKNLPSIVGQQYGGDFEIIVVNDRSTDESAEILETYQQDYSYIKIVTIDLNTPITLKGKKHALQQGILSASFDYLLLTDADCSPTSDYWLQNMTAPFQQDLQIVLGYGPYYADNTALNHCVQYETLMTAVQYFSHFWWNFPYMGIGRNLAYSKNIFFQAKGFENIGHILSGDDDLFVSKIASASNTTAILAPNTFCYSEPPKNWRSWYRQKQRHLSTGWHYKWVHKLSLGLFSISHFFFYISILFYMTVGIGSVFALSLVFFKFLVQAVTVLKIIQLFCSPLRLYQFFLIDLAFSLYHPILGLTTIKKSILWK